MHDLAARLHSAARSYCIERHTQWAQRYEELVSSGRAFSGSGYTRHAYRVFPRYQVLEAIRIDLERLSGVSFESLDEARDLFCLSGLTASNTFTEYKESEEARAAVEEERERFVEYVRGLNEVRLNDVRVLPYSKVLDPQEASDIWKAVEAQWGLKRRGVFYPLCETIRGDVVAFQAPHLMEAISPPKMAQLLELRGVSRVWELREYGPEYEIDVASLETAYNGAEGYWTSDTFDWIVYASHESSVTVGGWLLEDLKATWAEWGTRLWTSPCL